jgi:hypothetical protein
MTTKISRVELENGEVVTVEHPEKWTQSQITNFAILNAADSKRTSESSTSGPANKDDEITTKDLIGLGLARFGLQFTPDTFLMTVDEMRNEVDMLQRGEKVETPAQFAEREARELAGIPATANLTLTDEIIASFGDLTTYIGVKSPINVGEKLLRKLQPGVFLSTLLPAATANIAGVAGGMAASDVARQSGFDEYGQQIAGIVGGGAAGTVVGAGATPVIQTGTRVVKDVGRKVLGEKTEIFGPASEAMANSQVRSEINRIKNTTKPSEITRAVDNLASLKEEIPDLEIGGLVGTASDNPVVKDWVRKTTQANKGFQKEITEILARDAERLSDRFDVLLGESEAVSRGQIENVLRDNYKAKEAASVVKLEKQTENIDKALANLATRLTGEKDIFEVGKTAQRLVERKEALIRSEADKLYDTTKALANRVVLDPEMVGQVYNEFRQVRLADVFGPVSKVRNQLESSWIPKEKDGVMVVPKVTGTDVISLKKAVNTEITKLSKVGQTSENMQRLERLYQTKGIVNDMLSDLRPTAPEFVQSLKNADKFYFEQLGLPMRAEGMKDFTGKKFSEGAADTLMNYEKAVDYINFVGSQGLPVVRHAIRLKAERERVIGTDGTVQQAQLGRFVRRNKRMIERFGMTEEFSDIAGRLRTIRNTEARHDQAFKERAKELSNSFFKSIENNNLNSVVSKMKTSPGERKRYLNEISKLDKKQQDIVMSGLRQEFLNQGINNKGSMQEYVNANSEAVRDIFGGEYIANINKLAGLKDLMDNVSASLLDSLGGSPVIDTVKDTTGVSISEFAGTFRNQILSTERKFINLAAKAATTKGKEKFYAKSAEVLLDPDVVAKLANPPKGEIRDYLINVGEGLNDYRKDIGLFYTEALGKSLTLSTLKAVTAAEDIPVQELTEGAEAP